jgi:hypothetical protein
MKENRFPMRNTIIILVLAALTTFTSCRSTMMASLPTAQSYTHDQKETLEADTLGGFVFLPDTRVKVRSIHDTDSLWIEVRTSDTLSLRSMLINGTSVFIDPEAGKSSKFGISFPAARSEMMRRQEEILQQAQSENDTVPVTIQFDAAFWVDAMQKRDAVITDSRGTRFVDHQTASVSLNGDGELVYLVRFSFSQFEISGEEQQRISIGVLSQLHQAQMASPGGGGVATRPNITERERQQRQAQPSRIPRLRLIPINSWMAFLINEEMTEDTSQNNPSKGNDDVYFSN